MADRGQLHKNKKADFLKWAETQGYHEVPTKGPYEAFRIKKEGDAPHIFFERNNERAQHFTTQNRSCFLVRQFLKFNSLNRYDIYVIVAQREGFLTHLAETRLTHQAAQDRAREIHKDGCAVSVYVGKVGKELTHMFTLEAKA